EIIIAVSISLGGLEPSVQLNNPVNERNFEGTTLHAVQDDFFKLSAPDFAGTRESGWPPARAGGAAEMLHTPDRQRVRNPGRQADGIQNHGLPVRSVGSAVHRHGSAGDLVI